MLSRRYFLKATVMSVSALTTGCAKLKPIPVSGLPLHSIDIHSHIFNGLDVPVVGFLRSFINIENSPVGSDPYKGLLRLLKYIVLSETLTAEQEIDRMDNHGSSPNTLNARSAELQDRNRVARGISKFTEVVQGWENHEGLDPDQQMLMILLRFLGDEELVDFRSRGDPDRASEIANAIYAGRVSEGAERSLQSSGVNAAKLIQTIKWVGMLTRDRAQILSELKRLYGGRNKIEIFSPSLLDMELWYEADEGQLTVSPMLDQVNVMSRLAKQETDVILLNFVGFCPLRAALLEDNDPKNPHNVIKYAILEKGFAGVKIYPPLGYAPLGNDPSADFGGKLGMKVKGRKIDAELKMLYSWCIEHDVPIKTHANNSMGAKGDASENASPHLWERVSNLEKFKRLRVNLAHFGGFEESLVQDLSPQTLENWEVLAAEQVKKYNNYYIDIGFWSEVVRSESDAAPDLENNREFVLLRDLLSNYNELNDRIMYGSDWIMLGRVPAHNFYLRDVKRAFEELGLDMNKIMRDNAMRYLGVDRKGIQLSR